MVFFSKREQQHQKHENLTNFLILRLSHSNDKIKNTQQQTIKNAFYYFLASLLSSNGTHNTKNIFLSLALFISAVINSIIDDKHDDELLELLFFLVFF